MRAYLFDEQGEEVSQRGAPDWAMRMLPERLAVAAGRIYYSGAEGAERIAGLFGWAASLHAGDGTCPRGRGCFLGPRGMPIPGLIIGVITSGLVCYFLAWYLTKPIVRLRAATRQLAAGDLTARSGCSGEQEAG